MTLSALAIKSSKHANGMQKLERKEAIEKEREREKERETAETLAISKGWRVYCVKVAIAFLCARVPFEKIECFQELEESYFHLVDKRYLLNLIPSVLEEQTRIRQESS